MADLRPARPRRGLLLPVGPAHAVADRSREAETAGFDSAWVIEDYYSWECFATLGYLAAITPRLTLGVSVTTPYVRPIALLASAAATLDCFAAGRFILGIGRSTPTLLRQIGIADRAPLTMLAETPEVLRRLWLGETVTYHGRVVELDRVGLEVTPPRGAIPIYLGVIGPKALRIAGRVADGVILTSFCTVPYVRWAVAHLRAGAVAAGRDPASIDVAAIITTRVTDDAFAAREALKPSVALAYAMPDRGERLLIDSGIDVAVLTEIRAALKIEEIVDEGMEPYLHALRRSRPEDVATTVPMELVARAAVVGDVAQCRAQLAEYVASGVTHVVVDSPQPAFELMRALDG